MIRRLATLALVAPLALSLLAAAARADDEWRFRRTTPRAALSEAAAAIELGVPAGRAWGIESALRPLGAEAQIALRITVNDPAVREAFVRIAWYDRETGRPRQMEILDSELVVAGEDERVRVSLAAPDGAIAYRVRVLGRLSAGHVRSSDDAIFMTSIAAGARGPSFTRLRSEFP